MSAMLYLVDRNYLAMISKIYIKSLFFATASAMHPTAASGIHGCVSHLPGATGLVTISRRRSERKLPRQADSS